MTSDVARSISTKRQRALRHRHSSFRVKTQLFPFVYARPPRGSTKWNLVRTIKSNGSSFDRGEATLNPPPPLKKKTNKKNPQPPHFETRKRRCRVNGQPKRIESFPGSRFKTLMCKRSFGERPETSRRLAIGAGISRGDYSKTSEMLLRQKTTRLFIYLFIHS